ncbi:MAG TPA: hypothetical protein VEV85_07705 [Bryobacteraceae bacterium]|nr:hypothetical protein [Bryobacteraceae bacterium]
MQTLSRSLISLGSAAAAVIIAAGMAAPARADVVIYNGGAPDQGGQIYAQVPIQFVA